MLTSEVQLLFIQVIGTLEQIIEETIEDYNINFDIKKTYDFLILISN